MKTFQQLPLNNEILQNLESLGFEEMTPVQEMALPIVLEGKDLIAQAKTGSGKTAAFGLGILQQLEPKLFWPQALVLCPTRELAEQVCKELRRLARLMSNIKVLTISGGVSEYFQQKSLHHGVHIIVGTPGRVQKLLKTKSIQLQHLKTFVLDEADRMLDMGFYDDICKIATFTPAERQTLLFSATFPKEIKFLSKDLQRENTEHIKIDEKHESGVIKQISFPVPTLKAKLQALPLILANYRPESAIVFCNTKDVCRDVAKSLQDVGISALEIHGDLEQKERTLVMTKFSNNSCSILVATDVAARGLDINDLQAVISFDISPDRDVHIHRIGRTGRAGKEGLALNLFTPREQNYLNQIQKHQGSELEIMEIENLDSGLKFDIQPPMTTILISGGRKDNIRPGDILGALTGDAGIEGSAVGNIKIMDIFSYVAINTSEVDKAVSRLQAGKIKGRKFRVIKV